MPRPVGVTESATCQATPGGHCFAVVKRLSGAGSVTLTAHPLDGPAESGFWVDLGGDFSGWPVQGRLTVSRAPAVVVTSGLDVDPLTRVVHALGPDGVELPGWPSFLFIPGTLSGALTAPLVWNLDEGTIYDPESGRRMAIIGPFAMDAVLQDLESELGGSIPEVVVEAQRRYVKSRIEGGQWRRGGATFNRLTALRGLGNITFFEADENHLSVTIQNSCMPLLVLGMAQAIYETALGLENTTYEWKMDDDGDFAFTVNK